VGLIARAVEAGGLPTLSLTCCGDITELVKPPRACFLDYPPGNNVGTPNDAANQRAILRQVLASLPAFTQPGEIIDLPFTWLEADWEQRVVRTYEEEGQVVLKGRLASEFDAAGQHITRSDADAAATFCQDCAV